MLKKFSTRLIIVFIAVFVIVTILAAILCFGAAYILNNLVAGHKDWLYITAGSIAVLLGLALSWALVCKYKTRGNRLVEVVSGLLEAIFSGWF